MLFPNTTNWRAGMQDVSAAIDETMGELVTVTPVEQAKPNFPTIPCAERAVTVTAVFTSTPKTVVMGGEASIRGYTVSPLVETSEPIFSFDRSALPFHIKQGYRITLCRTGETFEAKAEKSDGVSRINVPVVQLGRQSEER